MRFCNFCAKNNDQVKNISENQVSYKNKVLKIENLLTIFQKDIVEFLLDTRESFICPPCLKYLMNCYEFVQQMKESEQKLQQGKEIKTEHDYFVMPKMEQSGDEAQSSEKITVNSEQLIIEGSITSNLTLKPILPKPPNEVIINKEIIKPINVKRRIYKCLKCEEMFKSFKALNEHENEYCKTLLEMKFQACKYCHKCFSKEDTLSMHITTKHSQGEYLCSLCEDKLFKGKGYLARHIEKTHHQKSLEYFCGDCPELVCLPTHEEVQQHFIKYHPVSITKTSLEEQTHVLNEEDMDLEMHEEFLDEFLLAHTNENSFQFSECWEALDLHLPDMLQASSDNLTHAEKSKESFSCPNCFEQFKNPQPLLQHLAEIHNLPVLICQRCQKSFTSFNHFKKHKMEKCNRSYTSTSPQLDCPYCSKSFMSILNLKQHLRIVHSQLKRHVCQLCDKQFSTLDHLKKHVLSQHQNERKHICTVCDKTFTQLSHLKQHLAIHTTGKTIQCSECSLKFWRKIDLQRHRQKKHGTV